MTELVYLSLLIWPQLTSARCFVLDIAVASPHIDQQQTDTLVSLISTTKTCWTMPKPYLHTPCQLCMRKASLGFSSVLTLASVWPAGFI